MKDLSIEEQIQIAKMCVKKGMPVESIISMKINIGLFPTEEQAEIYRIAAVKKIDQSIRETLNIEEKER